MAFRLTNSEQKTQNELVERLRQKWAAIEQAKDDADGEVQATIDRLNAVVVDYQNVVGEAEAFRDIIANRVRGDFDDRSEKWQEGDAGSSASDFISQWEDATFEEGSLLEVPSLDLDVEDHSDTLEGLPTEAE